MNERCQSRGVAPLVAGQSVVSPALRFGFDFGGVRTTLPAYEALAREVDPEIFSEEFRRAALLPDYRQGWR